MCRLRHELCRITRRNGDTERDRVASVLELGIVHGCDFPTHLEHENGRAERGARICSASNRQDSFAH